MSVKSHVNHVCKSVSFHLRNINSARQFLSEDACKLIVHSLISCRIDYANALLYGAPQKDLMKLQRLLNMAARIITFTPSTHHITPVLRDLHWLPITQRITYKILLLTFKILNNMGPSYLKELLTPFTSSRLLRSSSLSLLYVPKSNRKTLGDRAFSNCAPVLWNSLPADIKSSSNVTTFKAKLKTFLFKQAYE